MRLDLRKIVSLLIVPIYLALIVLVLTLKIWTSFNSPIPLLAFNFLFLGLIPVYVAYVAYKSVRGGGSASVLLIGTGIPLWVPFLPCTIG